MESVIRNVRDIDSRERQALEHVLGQQLKENQKVIIQVVTLGSQPIEDFEEQPAAQSGELPEWCNVYQGLTGEQIEDV